MNRTSELSKKHWNPKNLKPLSMACTVSQPLNGFAVKGARRNRVTHGPRIATLDQKSRG